MASLLHGVCARGEEWGYRFLTKLVSVSTDHKHGRQYQSSAPLMSWKLNDLRETYFVGVMRRQKYSDTQELHPARRLSF